MTEEKWLESNDTIDMWDYLRVLKTSRRKWRLFACACCRRLWRRMRADSKRKVVAAERYADGELTQDELTAAYPEAWCDISAWINVEDQKRVDKVYEAANAVINVDSSGSEIGSETALHVYSVRGATEEPVQAHFLRDIFGSPFSPVVAEVDWNTPSVLALARAAYTERSLYAGTLDSDRLAVLADALEDVGCDSADILEHLRSPGRHVRGCWVLDLLLEKC